MRKKLTNEEFEDRVYKNFDRTKLMLLDNYKNHKTKIKVQTLFGIHLVSPQDLLKGTMPTIMSAINKTEYYVKSVTEVHGDKYDYSLLKYEGQKNKVTIICPLHGEFIQNPSSHKNGTGCKKCGTEATKEKLLKSQDDFLKEVKQLKNDYDYSCAIYKGSFEKVEIICKNHGSFFQSPTNHLKGDGCPKCYYSKIGDRLKSNTEKFIEKANNIHNYKYTYSKINYINAITLVTITCKIHGDFEQTPNAHLSGHGCRKCANDILSDRLSDNPIGWRYSNWQKSAEISKNFDSFKVYVIKCWNEEEEFYKIGKTYLKIEERFRKNQTLKMPYNYKDVVQIVFEDAITCSHAENIFKSCNKINKYSPKIKFAGDCECFSKLDLTCFEEYNIEITD
jgi:hypothetical protein